MTHTELADNLSFLSALQMLMRLVKRKILTEDEAKAVRQELNQRLRPTI